MTALYCDKSDLVATSCTKCTILRQNRVVITNNHLCYDVGPFELKNLFQVVEGVKHVIESFNKASYTSQATNKRVAVLGAYLHCLLLISEVSHMLY